MINGGGDGGLRVQGDVSLNWLYLANGTLSGAGSLTITEQMVWAGGTLSTADGTNGSSPGSITIANTAALFLVGQENGATPVLDRPLTLRGKVGWIGSDGRVSVSQFAGVAQPQLFTNTAGMVQLTKLADLPPASAWQQLYNHGKLRGNFGDSRELALAVRTVLQPQAGSVPMPESWLVALNATRLTRNNLSALFEKLPALVRASVEVALRHAGENSASLFSLLSDETLPQNLRETATNALRYGQTSVLAPPNPLLTTVLPVLEMSGGLLAGLAVGLPSHAAEVLVGTVTLGVQFTQLLSARSPARQRCPWLPQRRCRRNQSVQWMRMVVCPSDKASVRLPSQSATG